LRRCSVKKKGEIRKSASPERTEKRNNRGGGKSLVSTTYRDSQTIRRRRHGCSGIMEVEIDGDEKRRNVVKMSSPIEFLSQINQDSLKTGLFAFGMGSQVEPDRN